MGLDRSNEQQITTDLNLTKSPMPIETTVAPGQCAANPPSSAASDPVVGERLQPQTASHGEGDARKSMEYGLNMSTAVSSGDVERTLRLLKSYDVNCKSSLGGKTPLITATIHRHEHMIKLLIEHGASQGVQDKAGFTALHHLSRYNGVKLTETCIDLFFQYRPPFDVKNRDGETPLTIACVHGEEELAVKLIHDGADIHAHDNMGGSILHCAAQNERSSELITLLIREGALVDVKTKGVWEATPLHVVAQYCKHPIAAVLVERLLNAGANREARSRY